MINITIKGRATTDFSGNLIELDGIDCQDCFSDYFDDDILKFSELKGLKGGYAEFNYIADELWVYTTYQANELLTDEEIQLLANYTQGQWSDGIGEGFEQFPCAEIDDEEIYISMWFPGQILTVEQNENII